ncbi:MAG: hypothetical protein M0R80_02265 [Proteobacteria bacterium]|jgi:hypothetical protein|nr:hypothetical protein [Pseudomonadota bacterium]
MKIDKQNFEKLGIKNWSSFIDPRQLFAHLAILADEQLSIKGKVTSIRITRFELSLKGIIIWIEYIVNYNAASVNIISEFLLVNDELIHQTTAKM